MAILDVRERLAYMYKLLLNELWKQIVIQFNRFLMGCLTKLKTEGYRIS